MTTKVPHALTMRAGSELRRPQKVHDVSRPIGRRELVCPVCGYRIVLDREPDRCPMCGGEEWVLAGSRPFSRR